MLALIFYSFVFGFLYEWAITILLLGGWLGAGRAAKSESSELSRGEWILVYTIMGVGYYLLFSWLAFSASYSRVNLMGPSDAWLWWIPIFMISVGPVWRLTGSDISSCLVNFAAPVAFICFIVWPSVTFGPFSWALKPMDLQWTRQESTQLRMAVESHNKEQEAAKLAEQIQSTGSTDPAEIQRFRATLAEAVTQAEQVDPSVFLRFDKDGPEQYLGYVDGMKRMVTATDSVLLMLSSGNVDESGLDGSAEEFGAGSRQVDLWTSWAREHMNDRYIPIFRD